MTDHRPQRFNNHTNTWPITGYNDSTMTINSWAEVTSWGSREAWYRVIGGLSWWQISLWHFRCLRRGKIDVITYKYVINHCLSFFFCLVYFLSFYLLFLVIPLVSSNLSYLYPWSCIVLRLSTKLNSKYYITILWQRNQNEQRDFFGWI